MAREKMKHYAAACYHRTTPNSITWTIAAALGLLVFLIFFATTAAGIFAGASAAIDGEPLNTAEVASVETEMWSEFDDGSPLARGLYGLMHWFVALSISTAVWGMELGYAVPELGHVLSWVARPVPYLIMVLFALQLIRLLELIFRGSRAEGS